MVKESVISLIKKLFALSTSPNEHEAALAMSKAQDLLTQYNLDIASINSDNGKGEDDESNLINELVDFDNGKASVWQRSLLHILAINNFCRTINLGNGKVNVLGRKANVRAIVSMYNWLEPQIIRLANQSGYKRSDKSSYVLGIVNALNKRLRDNAEDYKRNNPMSTALVVNVQGEVDRYFKSEYPHTTKSRVSSVNGNAYSHGQGDAGKVSIYGSNRQVNHGTLQLN